MQIKRLTFKILYVKIIEIEKQWKVLILKKIELNGIWELSGNGYLCKGKIPGSLYSFLLDNKLMDNPHFRDNELTARELCDYDYDFSRTFEISSLDNKILLHADGIDTVADIYINGKHIAYTDNMHRMYEFDVTSALKTGTNEIKITCHSAENYLKSLPKEKEAHGVWHAVKNYGNLRKAECMFGWDWGPRLPDCGIWRDIYLIEKNSARITEFNITQRHENGRVFITPLVTTDKPATIKISMTSPNGEKCLLDANKENEVVAPLLWWPNNMGEQHLYNIVAEIIENGNVCDSASKNIGLRTLKLIREKDEYGESFCHEVNGVKFFAMGADYIPEDNIFSRITPERTRNLLLRCKDSNFNAIRVWGGGYYPDDYFFDYCDEMGIIVFLDLMFACTTVYFDDAMIENISIEIEQNLSRLRHHASMALISGNNEIEETILNNPNATDEEKNQYIHAFEGVIPDIIKKVCPDIAYVPSSPSSCGHFIAPTNENYGDCHYWEVWHGNAPFTKFRTKFFRYLSEFGFQSFPCEKTVKQFTLPKDRNIFSYVMEMHQRNSAANGKILTYLSNTFKYPADFSTLLYTSQLLQAEAIRYGVEHFRRNRGRCMGTLYWQLNDIWPVASWASIDYYGRYKALQYYAKRFYQPIMISCLEIGEQETRKYVTFDRDVDFETTAQLFVNNDTMNEVSGEVRWYLRSNDGNIIESGKEQIIIPALSVKSLEKLDFKKTDTHHNYFSFEFIMDENVVSCGTAMFTAPKYFDFIDPQLTYEINGDEITVYSKAYAKSIEIYSDDSDFVLSDNFFDLNADKITVKVIEGKPENIKLRSVFDIK